jgi:hypothetical protein
VGAHHPSQLEHLVFAIRRSKDPQDVRLVLECADLREADFVFTFMLNFTNMVRMPEMDADKLREFLRFFSSQRIRRDELVQKPWCSSRMDNTKTDLFLTSYLDEAAQSGRADIVQVLLEDGRADAFRDHMRPLRLAGNRVTEQALMRHYMAQRSSDSLSAEQRLELGRNETFKGLLPVYQQLERV